MTTTTPRLTVFDVIPHLTKQLDPEAMATFITMACCKHMSDLEEVVKSDEVSVQLRVEAMAIHEGMMTTCNALKPMMMGKDNIDQVNERLAPCIKADGMKNVLNNIELCIPYLYQMADRLEDMCIATKDQMLETPPKIENPMKAFEQMVYWMSIAETARLALGRCKKFLN